MDSSLTPIKGPNWGWGGVNLCLIHSVCNFKLAEQALRVKVRKGNLAKAALISFIRTTKVKVYLWVSKVRLDQVI